MKRKCICSDKVRKRHVSIRMKLLLLVLMPVIALVIVGVSIYQVAAGIIVNNYETSAYATLQEIGDYMSLALEGVQNTAVQYISDTDLQKYYNGQMKKDQAAELKQYNKMKNDITTLAASGNFIENVYIFGGYGENIATSGNISGLYEAYQASEEAAMWEEKSNRFLWCGYHRWMDEALGQKEDAYGLSVIFAMKNRNGFVVIDVGRSEMLNVLQGLDTGENGVIGFVANDGRELLCNYENNTYFTNTEFGEISFEKGESTKTEYRKVDGKEMICMYYQLKDIGVLCAAIPREEILAKMNDTRNLAALVIAGAVILTVCLGFIISFHMSAAINKITQATKQAAGGDLNILIQSKRNDEIGRMTEGFAKMLESVKHLIKKATSVSASVSETAENIHGGTEELLMTSRQMDSAFGDIKKGTEEQAEETEKSMMQMNLLSDCIGDVVKENHEIQCAVNLTQEISEQGKEIVGSLEQISHDTVGITNHIVSQVHNLKNEMLDIDEIIVMIKEIGEQTNLLSLNASIEAARAGKDGKGFAVVAAEIRNLAEQSMTSVDRVKKIIESIQDKMGDLESTANVAGNNVVNQKDSLYQAIDLFLKINQSVERLTGNLDRIQASMDKIEEVKSRTMVSIEDFVSIAHENAAVSESLNEIAEKQLIEVEKLSQMSLSLKENKDELEGVLSRFKV